MQPYVRSASRSSGGPRPGLRAPARKDHECADDARRALRRCSPNLLLLQSTQKTSSRAPAASPGRSFCEERAPHSALSAVVPGRQLGVPCPMEEQRRCTPTRPRPGRTLLHGPRASPETSAHASHKNHKHVCTVTCVKYQKKPTASSFATASRSRQKKGNWHFEVQVTFLHQRQSPHRHHPQVCHAPAQVYRAGGVRRHRQRGERIQTKHASAHDDVHVLVFGRVAGRSPLQCRLRVPEAVRSRCPFLRTVGRRGTGARDAWLHRFMSSAACALFSPDQSQSHIDGYASSKRGGLLRDEVSMQPAREAWLHHAAFPCKNTPHRSTRGQEEQRQQSTIQERVRHRFRRFIFSANRSMLFSACELATYVMIGDAAIKTEPPAKTFSGRGMVMMHECKRLLNDSTSDGLLFPGRSATGIDATVSHMLAVPRAATLRYIERAELPRKGGPESFLLKVDVYQHFVSYYALSFSACRCCDKRQLLCRTWGRSANAPTSTKARHVQGVLTLHRAGRMFLEFLERRPHAELHSALPPSLARPPQRDRSSCGPRCRQARGGDAQRHGPRHHAFQKSSNIAQPTSVSAETGPVSGCGSCCCCSWRICPERGLLIEFLDISLPWHAELPHLAEWRAFFARDILFQLHQTADAKNMTQAQAKKRASQLVQDVAEDEGLTPNTCRFAVQDLGGAATDLGDDAAPPDLAGETHELRLPSNRVALVAEDGLFLIVMSSIYVLILRHRCFVHVWDLCACSGQSMCACSGSFAAQSLRHSHDCWI